MVDEPNRSKDLEAEINRLEGVVRSIFLVGPGGEPVEAQIFYRRGTSVPRIRRGVEALLLSIGKLLDGENISVFELEDEPAAPVPVPVPVVAPPAAVESPAPNRTLPIFSLTSSLLAVVALMLLLTAPWVALVRLITEPLRTAPAGQAVPVTRPSSVDNGPIRVAVAAQPETAAPASPRPVAVAGVRITQPTTATSASRPPLVVARPAVPAQELPTPPAVIPTPPTNGGGNGSVPPAGNDPKPPDDGVDRDDDDDDEGDDDRRHRTHKRSDKSWLKEKDRSHDRRRKAERARKEDCEDDDRDWRSDDDDD